MTDLGGDALRWALERVAAGRRRNGEAGVFSPADYTACARRWELTPERSGLRPTTVRTLVGHLPQWELWARRNGHAPRPATPAAVIGFLAWRERETSHKTA